MRRSYNAYLKWRDYWSQRGYSLNEKMTPKQYTEWHMSQTLDNLNKEAAGEPFDPNIARTIVKNELAYTGGAAQKLAKQAKKIKYEEYEEDYSDYDIYDVAAQKERRQNEELKAISKRWSNWRDIIAAEDREQVFLELAKADVMDVDLWDYDSKTREKLYGDQIKRFREDFEANLYKEGKSKR